jgi:hypothetical protein
MIMRKALFHLLVILSVGMHGQATFQVDFRNGTYIEGYSLIESDDNGFIAAGAAKGIFLLKVNSLGDTLWSRDIGTGSFATSIIKSNDGNYVVCGSIGCCGSEDIILLKIDGNGDTLWTKQYGSSRDEQAHSLIQTTDGGYAVSGWGYNTKGSINAFIIKTDSSGETQWCKLYGDSVGADWGFNISQTGDGGYILCGQSEESCYALRLDVNGNKVWAKTYHAYAYGTASCVKETSDGGFIICGGTADPRDEKKGYLIKTNSQGDTLWTRLYAYGDRDLGFTSVAELPGGYLVGGPYAIRTDLNGDIIWARSLGTRFNYGFPTADSGFAFVTGQMRLVKTDSKGLAGCNEDNLNLKRVVLSYEKANNHNVIVNAIPYFTKPYKNAVIRSGVSVYPVCEGVTKIAEPPTKMQNISIYPNPNLGEFRIEQEGCYTVTIHDMMGCLLSNCEGNGETTIRIDAKGLFLITVKNGSLLNSQKVIVE